MCLLLTHTATAGETTASGLQVPVLPKVTVSGSTIDTLTTEKSLDRQTIYELPNSSGNINDLLKAIPGVQFSESADSSRTGGEIKPAELSISGGRTADNSYLFDGITNNSLLDPDFTNPDNIENIPGHSNSLFILDHLVKEATVLNANIPARYGNFTGGVVATKSIEPEDEVGGELSYRFTRSEWGQFYIDPPADTEVEKQELIDEFKHSTSADNQPKFVKYQSSATFHLPINEKTGLVLDYSRAESSIPLSLLNEKKVQRRRDENFFLKTTYTPSDNTKLTLSATYAPYQGDYFKENTINSDYALYGGGFQITTQLTNKLSVGTLESNISYQQSENSREAPADWYSWRATPSKSWGMEIGASTSFEGGHGDLYKTQKQVSSDFHINFNKLKTGPVLHQFNAGSEIINIYATTEKTETSTQYIATLADGSSDPKSSYSYYYPTVTCPAGMIDCVEGEQFISSRTIRPAYKANAYIGSYSIYLEDQIELGRFDVRPGVRVTYNDFQNNTNYAPRFASSIDLLGDGTLFLKGGANRYYGSNLLTQKLDEERARTLYQTRNSDWRQKIPSGDPIPNISQAPDPWDPDDITTKSFFIGRVTDLDTPYADELTLGAQLNFLGGTLDLTYIDRDYRKQIVPVRLEKDLDTGIYYRVWRNSGERDHEEVTASWEQNWPGIFLYLAATWEETKSNSASYSYVEKEFAEKTDDINDLDRPALYREQIYNKNDLPTQNYNRPIKATLHLSAELPFGFTFTNRTNYRGRYRSVEDTGENIDYDNDPDTGTAGKETDVYADVTKSSALTFDWSIVWESPKWRKNSWAISLEILNVFNRRVPDGTKDGEYLLGRQYWAGMTYKF